MKPSTASLLIMVALIGCERKQPGGSANIMVPPITYHGNASVLVMGQSNGQELAQSQGNVLLANAQALYPGTDHIIDCAIPGSGELTWVPGSVNYQNCLAAVRKDGHPVAFILWWQGETEAGPNYPGTGTNDPYSWAATFVSLMNQFRGAIAQPNTEVLYVRLSDDPQNAPYQWWQVVRAQQASVVLPHGWMVNIDGIPANAFPHFDIPGYLQCAQRMIPRGQ